MSCHLATSVRTNRSQCADNNDSRKSLEKPRTAHSTRLTHKPPLYQSVHHIVVWWWMISHIWRAVCVCAWMLRARCLSLSHSLKFKWPVRVASMTRLAKKRELKRESLSTQDKKSSLAVSHNSNDDDDVCMAMFFNSPRWKCKLSFSHSHHHDDVYTLLLYALKIQSYCEWEMLCGEASESNSELSDETTHISSRLMQAIAERHQPR